MARPHLDIDPDKIEHNARTIVALCREHAIEVIGVTKGVCGHPAVARAMLRGGVAAIGDSRLEHVQRMRAAGVGASYHLLRVPGLSDVDDVVASVDVSLESAPPGVGELVLLGQVSDARLVRADLIDEEHPWRHDGAKLARAIMAVYQTGPN